MQTVLVIHCIFRWFVLAMILGAIAIAFVKWFGNKDVSTKDTMVFKLAARAIEIQILLGIILYVMKRSWEGFSSMDVDIMRFHALEHPFGMIIAVALISIGNAKSRKQADHTKKHKIIAIWYTIALVLIVASIPWSFRF